MDISFSSSSDTKSLFSLLCITEELLFSIPLHSDLVEKYMVLRETSLKKVGINSNSSNLWDLQKQAYQDLSQKHSSQEKQIKSLSESLDLCRTSYKELHEIHSKILEFCYDINAQMQKTLNKPVFNQGPKENIQISMGSNLSQLNKTIFSEFSVLKEDLKSNHLEISEKYQKETQKTSEKTLENKYLAQEYESKLKDLSHKLDFLEEESRLKTEKQLLDQKRLHIKELEDQKSHFSLSESKKSKEIEDLKKSYEKDLRQLQEDKNSVLESLSSSIKNSHKQELKELELSFRTKEHELLEELEIATNTDSSVLKSLRENMEKAQIKIQDLREVLRAIEERTHALFSKYAYKQDIDQEFQDRQKEIANISLNKAWQQYSEVLTQLDFMSLAYKKITSDNEWLLEQIDELTKENNDLKSRKVWENESFGERERWRYEERRGEEGYEAEAEAEEFYRNGIVQKSGEGGEYSYEQVLSTLSANEVVIKDFQDARSKLLKQFAEAKRNT